MSQSTTGTPDLTTGLLKKIKANDDATLRKLYTDNYPQIAQYIIRNNGTSDDAKDIYQEAFLAFWRNIQLDRFIPKDDSSLTGYLFRIAQFKWRDHLRKIGREPTIALAETDLPDTDSTSASEDEYITKIKLHYTALGDQCKEVLKKFYFLKQSLREIATQFSWTEASAKNNKYRCLQKLRNLVLGKN
jgi:RNA polymerase sigma factor (sigma-70 family)